MEGGRITNTTDFYTRLSSYVRTVEFIWGAASFLLSFLLSGIELFRGIMPMGLGILIALDLIKAAPLWYALSGTMLGSLIAGHYLGIAVPVVYVGLCALYMLWRGGIEKRMERLLIFALSVLLMLPLFCAAGLIELLAGIATLGLTMLLAVAYYRGLYILRRVQKRRVLFEEEQLCVCLLLASVILALSPIQVAFASVSYMLLSFSCLIAVFARGLQGVAVAVAISFMLVAGAKADALLVANVAACSLAAAACRRTGRIGTAIAYVLSCALISLYVKEHSMHVGLFNGLVAGGLFILTPRDVMLAIRAAVDKQGRKESETRHTLVRMQQRTSRSLYKAASAMNQIADIIDVQNDPPTALDESKYVLHASEHICHDCERFNSCWRDKNAALRAVYALIPAHQRGMRPQPQKPLFENCPYIKTLAAGASQACIQYREGMAKSRVAFSQCEFAKKQMQGMGSVMRDMAVAVVADIWQERDMELAIHRALDEEGFACRNICAMRTKSGLIIELMLSPQMEREEQDVIACLEYVISRPLRKIKGELRKRGYFLELEMARSLCINSGTATLPMEGSAQSGDASGHKALPGGQELFVLSDGMGTGVKARQKSDDAVAMLLELYSVGLTRENTLSCVNRLHSGKDEMYATLDAVLINLESGEAEFIKCGAPPCFVLRNGNVYPVRGEALPAGILSEAQPAVHRATLQRHDTLVLLTDGTLDALGEDISDEIRRNVECANTPQDAANSLLMAARARSVHDDMSVMVARVS